MKNAIKWDTDALSIFSTVPRYIPIKTRKDPRRNEHCIANTFSQFLGHFKLGCIDSSVRLGKDEASISTERGEMRHSKEKKSRMEIKFVGSFSKNKTETKSLYCPMKSGIKIPMIIILAKRKTKTSWG